MLILVNIVFAVLQPSPVQVKVCVKKENPPVYPLDSLDSSELGLPQPRPTVHVNKKLYTLWESNQAAVVRNCFTFHRSDLLASPGKTLINWLGTIWRKAILCHSFCSYSAVFIRSRLICTTLHVGKNGLCVVFRASSSSFLCLFW